MCSFLDSLVKMTNGQNEVKMMFSDVLYSRKEQVDERVPKTERPKVERPFLPRGERGGLFSLTSEVSHHGNRREQNTSKMAAWACHCCSCVLPC